MIEKEIEEILQKVLKELEMTLDPIEVIISNRKDLMAPLNLRKLFIKVH